MLRLLAVLQRRLLADEVNDLISGHPRLHRLDLQHPFVPFDAVHGLQAIASPAVLRGQHQGVLHRVKPIVRGGPGVDPLQEAVVLLLGQEHLHHGPPPASLLLLRLDLLLPFLRQGVVHPGGFQLLLPVLNISPQVAVFLAEFPPIYHPDAASRRPQRHGLEPALGMVRRIGDFLLAEAAPHLVQGGDLDLLQPILQLLLHVVRDRVGQHGKAEPPPLGLVAPHGRVIDVLVSRPLELVQILRVASVLGHGDVGDDLGYLRLGQSVGQHGGCSCGSRRSGRMSSATSVLLHVQGVYGRLSGRSWSHDVCSGIGAVNIRGGGSSMARYSPCVGTIDPSNLWLNPCVGTLALPSILCPNEGR